MDNAAKLQRVMRIAFTGKTNLVGAYMKNEMSIRKTKSCLVLDKIIEATVSDAAFVITSFLHLAEFLDCHIPQGWLSFGNFK